MTRISRIAVVIPARDEAERIDTCILSVLAARERVPRARVRIVVVADNCSDDTAARAARHTAVTVLETNGSNVGAARLRGARFAIMRRDQWLANTDADSVVPADWFEVQLELAAGGADVIVGTVRPDFSELSDSQLDAWLRTHDAGQAIGHVHGANLGIRSSAYIRSGGFKKLAEHEDTDLVERMSLTSQVIATQRGEVVTSGRSVGRTSGGYARFLREDLLRSVDLREPADF